MRFNEPIPSACSDVAVKLFGDDVEVLADVGARLEAALASVPGAADTKVEQTTGRPLLSIHLKRAEMARLGLNVADVQDVIEVAIRGRPSARSSTAIAASTFWFGSRRRCGRTWSR